MNSSIKPPVDPGIPIDGVESLDAEISTEAPVSSTEKADWNAAVEAADHLKPSSSVDMQGLSSIQSETMREAVVKMALEGIELADLGDEDLAEIERDLRDALDSDPTVRTLFEERNSEI